MSLVIAKGLTKTYRMGDVEVQAIRSADFIIEPASFVAFVGPSGSGKSTLLNMIGRRYRRSEGLVIFAFH
jgi:putative ABC transport system ATP-binding protein